MAYTKQTWANTSGGGTPISAARLNYVEDGLQTAASDADSAVTTAGTAASDAAAAVAAVAAAQTLAEDAIPVSALTGKGSVVSKDGAGDPASSAVPTSNDRILVSDDSAAPGLSWGPALFFATEGSPPTATAVNDLWVVLPT